jgi:hypothetical protein
LLARPAVEVGALVELDNLLLDAEHDSWPVGIVLGHGEPVFAHEHTFAYVKDRVLPLEPSGM